MAGKSLRSAKRYTGLLGAWGGYNPATDITGSGNFEAWLGRSVDAMVTNFNQDSRAAFNSGFTPQIANYNSFTGKVMWGIPLICDGETLEQGAAGDFDVSWTSCAQAIYDARHLIEDEAWVRPNWEFNGDWMPWASLGKESVFISVWQRWVDICEDIAPDYFKQNWCPNLGQNNPMLSYPGDDYVDQFGMDVYYNVADGYATGYAAFAFFRDHAYGLNFLNTQAAAHDMPVSFPEWGVNSDLKGSEFIDEFGPFMRRSDVILHGYWESNAAFAGKLQDNQYPLAGAAYQGQFGP